MIVGCGEVFVVNFSYLMMQSRLLVTTNSYGIFDYQLFFAEN
jgi:hypothetical protein